MLSTNRLAVTRVRHALQIRPVTVGRVERISPHFARISFEGDSLRDFASASFSDHVKLMLPPSPGAPLVLPTLGAQGPTMPPGEARPVMRDYTPRSFDGRTLVIEMALHGDGPATSWAARAAVGDLAGIGGPKGSTVIPLDFDVHWLVGDDTALPAIARRLEELPSGCRAVAVVEVGDAADRRDLTSSAEHRVVWVVRGADPPGALLDAVASLPAPIGEAFAWAAGEHRTMAAIRACLLEHHGLPRDRVRVAAYWKSGERGHHARLDD